MIKKSNNKLISIIAIIILGITILTLTMKGYIFKNDRITTSISSIEPKADPIATTNMTAKEAISQMGFGINLGEWRLGSDLYKTSYTFNVSYNSQDNTSVIDKATSTPTFGTSEYAAVEWKMSSLKSTGKLGKINIQIKNSKLKDSKDTKLKYKITGTKLTLASGTVINIGGTGTYSSKITDNAADAISIDLSNVSGITNTSDLEGATLIIRALIVDYASPRTSQTITINKNVIDAIKAQGITTIRFPITYQYHMDSDGNIDTEWLDQIQKVVDYIMEDGLYCIINLHGDGMDTGWVSLANVDDLKDKYQTIWKCIATRFANYDNHLIYESINEPLNYSQSNMWDVYNTAVIPTESISNLNKLNQYFVDEVRSIKGNENRFLMVTSYGAKEFSVWNTYNNNTKFTLPTDTAKDKIMVDVHIYQLSKNDLGWRMNGLKKSGYPIYLGEFGAYKTNLNDTTKETLEYFVSTLASYGIQCAIWDDNGNMAVLNRSAVNSTNYTSNDLWYGNSINYIPTLVEASKISVIVNKVTLDKTELNIQEGKIEKITATITPDDATNKEMTWTSSDVNVATVDSNGNVTAVKAGTATITAKTKDQAKTATCSITVTEAPATVNVTGVTLNQQSTSIEEETTTTLTATVTPNDATNKNVTWKSSDESIATVDQNGKITAIKAGTATITVTTEDQSKTASCNVTVTAKAPTIINVTNVTLDKNDINIEEEATEQLTATVTPDDATNKKVTWKSDNESIATVDQNGKITAIKAGTVTIIATTEDQSKTASCKVTVTAKTPPIINVTNVTLDKNDISIEEEETEQLTATVTPDDATNKKVTWTSSDESIATVDQNGKITAIKAGTATITITTEDQSKAASCNVTVTAKPKAIKKITLSVKSRKIKKNSSEDSTITVEPADASTEGLIWKSSNTKVAIVDSNGKITAINPGITTITVSTADNSVSSSYDLTVEPTTTTENTTTENTTTGNTITNNEVTGNITTNNTTNNNEINITTQTNTTANDQGNITTKNTSLTNGIPIVNSTELKDRTIKSSKLPQTGEETGKIALVSFAIIVVGIISYIMYRKNNYK